MSKKECCVSVHGIDLDGNSILFNRLLSQTGQAMLIDGVIDFQSNSKNGVSITTYKSLDESDHVFDGHFPDKPICPGHNLLQMCILTAQLFLFCLEKKMMEMPKFIKIKEIINRFPATPGDTLYVTCIDPEITENSFTCTAFIKNQNCKTVAQVNLLTLSIEEFDATSLGKVQEKSESDLEFITVNEIYLNASNIARHSLLPHRDHALLTDGITAFQNDYQHANITSACNITKGVTFSGFDYCQGHIMLEMAYIATAMFHYCLTQKAEGTPAPISTENVEFIRPALPGEILYITCNEPEIRSKTFSCSTSVFDRNQNLVAKIGKIKGISMR